MTLSDWSQDRMTSAVCAVLGIVLVAASALPALGAFRLFQAESLSDAAEKTSPPNGTQLQEAVTRAKQAVTLDRGSAPAASFLADTLVRNFDSGLIPESTPEELRSAAERAVRLSPADPYAWYLLAVTDQLSGALSAQGQKAFNLSLILGRDEGQLIFPRLSFCATNWPSLDDPTHELCAGQFALAFGWQLGALARFVAEADEAGQMAFGQMLKAGLPSEDDRIEKFRRRVSRYQKS